MRKQYLLLLITTFFLFPGRSAFASTETKKEEEKLIEELTGKKSVAPPPVAQALSQTAVKTERTMPRKLLDAGYYAYTQKEFIDALKYYNTIIVKYPGSPEVRLAYLGKAKLYTEMGLDEQAQLNLKTANEMTNKTQNIK